MNKIIRFLENNNYIVKNKERKNGKKYVENEPENEIYSSLIKFEIFKGTYYLEIFNFVKENEIRRVYLQTKVELEVIEFIKLYGSLINKI